MKCQQIHSPSLATFTTTQLISGELLGHFDKLSRSGVYEWMGDWNPTRLIECVFKQTHRKKRKLYSEKHAKDLKCDRKRIMKIFSQLELSVFRDRCNFIRMIKDTLDPILRLANFSLPFSLSLFLLLFSDSLHIECL